MKKKIFKYRLVYYLAVAMSLLFFIISSFSILNLFDDFSIFKTMFIGTSIVINLFAFINLIEKYNKAVLFLNLSLSLAIVALGYPILLVALSGRYYDVWNFRFKFWILFILILAIVNIFKVRVNSGINEIENIGKHED
ncbi:MULTISPECIES: hypothetical protein [unclassified Chryseobacterium]|uniref:hypothetical protein n=1 Tax=unclassified Chryseobacterium TaxID=2593645 RepID=UPI001DBF10C0|nr:MULTISPECIES: hypothetical protein [unclassified Chryseobacterium]MCQ9636267.1 hypothetical protein [Chryseobacterium sp. WG23]CAH0165205.1 hypothetical protein SRABI04_01111 [Chryseobacterium sp. Bi04]